MTHAARTRLTGRLRLEPIGPQHADDLWTIHHDDAVAEWSDRLTREEAQRRAASFGAGWEHDGVSKWIAYDDASGALIGRGGLSWADVDGERSLEIGWAILSPFWGCGYATEIGREGLAFAFNELRAERVVAFTEVHNTRSRAVMERIGMSYVRTFNARGLVEGRSGEHDDAPFVLYEICRPAPA